MVPHPSYNSKTLQNDLMIIKLNGRVPSKVQPVKLNTDASTPNDGAIETAIGFGRTSTGGSGSSQLLEVQVKKISYSVCQNAWGSTPIFNDQMICSDSSNGKSVCQGDSGGPYLLKGGSAAGDVQVGITSFGLRYGCASSTPDVNTRVSYYSQWIQSQICSLAVNPPSSCNSPPTPSNPKPSPTKPPTSKPRGPPTRRPKPISPPTVSPTISPSTESPAPSPYPTTVIDNPTDYPTVDPTDYPTDFPSMAPTKAPTKAPTRPKRPTKAPTKKPTKVPTRRPTRFFVK